MKNTPDDAIPTADDLRHEALQRRARISAELGCSLNAPLATMVSHLARVMWQSDMAKARRDIEERRDLAQKQVDHWQTMLDELEEE